MNENTKTAIFVVVAALVGLVAWGSLPAASNEEAPSEVGTFISPDFKDPLDATSLEIVDFDEEKAEPRVFKVEEVNGRWSLPSHFNYPADAEKQMSSAAASLIDLEILSATPITQADYAKYGVADPTTASLGAEGFGKHVTLSDKDGKKLTDIVIGSELADRPGLRYVRVPGRDVIYEVKIDPSKLSTRFADWIEDDLLKLNPWDVERVLIDDYSIDEANGRRVQGDLVKLTFSEQDSSWQLEGLAEGEELDATKLNEMKTALDDLKIVDVRRKPNGLSSTLRAEGDGRIDQQAILSLMSRGFYVTQDGALLSNEGEVICTLKDGVEYVLRFGEIATGTEEAAPGEEPQAEGEEAKAEGEETAEAKEGEEEPLATVHETGPNRYVMLTVGFNPEMIPKPELTPLPGESEADPAEAADGETPAEDAAPAEAATPAEGDKPAEPAADAPAEGETPPAEKTEEQKQQDAQREQIERENAAKQKEYDDKVAAAEKQVKELNDRFADWYYVISNDVYKKIRLTRDQVLKLPDANQVEGETQEFDELKEGGVSAEPAPSAEPAVPEGTPIPSPGDAPQP